jgi:hypothetical protein
MKVFHLELNETTDYLNYLIRPAVGKYLDSLRSRVGNTVIKDKGVQRSTDIQREPKKSTKNWRNIRQLK